MVVVKQRSKWGRTVRRTAIVVFIMLLLAGAGGVAYVYFSGKNMKDDNTAPPTTTEANPLPKPVQPAANAPEGVAVSAVTSPVKTGTNASITVQTNAASKCTVSVVYNNVPSTDSGLAPKTADPYGNVTWTWTVAPTTPVGTGAIKVTCVYNGRSAVVDAKQEVQ